MTAEEFETRVINWARSRPEVEALIQIGSRAQLPMRVDVWSDWDYHLIVRDLTYYRSVNWLREIGLLWCAHRERTERGIEKISAVFVGGHEVDFVPLSAWQMRLVYWAMARPSLRNIFPRTLVRGIANTQLVVKPGYRVLVGGATWEARLAALRIEWPACGLSVADCLFHVSAFWRHAVWVAKKIARGETRAAQRWYHVELLEHRWILLEEESRLAKRVPRPEARMAEQWLDHRWLKQTEMATSANQQALARALLCEVTLFEEVARSVANQRAFELPDYSDLANWLKVELQSLAAER